ncbi:MAG: hypothetical protein A2033_09645 [Bacteroidetes bacterium GWA2_31_9]|nr:MAG: hypothetical protein A2033_09645 [Bacteroidetes bacterium GWA2_31_9]
MKYIVIIVFLITFFNALNIKAQEKETGQISGNLQSDIQFYREDSAIGAPFVPERLLSNTYANVNYIKGKFLAGVRFESYLNTLKGFDSRNTGVGFPYRWASYDADDLNVTVGSFYEQFGSGLIFRSYEEKALGYDNAMDGLRLKYKIFDGIYLKGVFGRQRLFFESDSKGYSYLRNGQGIVRGIDGEFVLNDCFKKYSEKKLRITLGGSFVSKYQKDSDPVYNLPENVAASSGRINIGYGKVSLSGEYAYKINDPSSDNNYIYKNGEALLINASYSQKGLGVFVTAKRIDNMSFRSDRTANLSSLNINYIPVISKNHSYSMAAFYPYASQPNGEMGIQGELMYKVKKQTLLGGKYGMSVAINYSVVQGIEQSAINDTISINQTGTLGYNSDFFGISDNGYYQDFNIEISKKISKKFSMILTYLNLMYNYDVLRGVSGHGKFFSNIGIADLTYKIKENKSIKLEMQHLYTEHDLGNWGMALVEYSIAPKWFFSILDMYNYGNPDSAKQLHYFSASIGFAKKANRFQISYGRQREGITCVGGVCRNVPASNGLTLSITSSF